MERKTLVVEKTRHFPIDVLRGLAVSLMIFANNMGDWDHVYPCMDHAPWIGFTLIDWVFPVFLFCMGFSMIFSLKKYDKLDSAFFKKILTRTVILYAIGILMRTIGGVCGKLTAGNPLWGSSHSDPFGYSFLWCFPETCPLRLPLFHSHCMVQKEYKLSTWNFHGPDGVLCPASGFWKRV